MHILDQMSHEETNRQRETPTAGSDAGKIYFDNPARAERLKIFTLNSKNRLSVAGGMYLV
jgi:hypothetical protein